MSPRRAGRRLALLLLAALWAGPAAADPPADIVTLEDLTWTEVRDRMAAGATTVIVPTGGTEQNGPHMVLGKHNMIVRYTAQEIARRVGNVLVAPVLAYTPEGAWDPPEGHMRFPGTISLPSQVFEAVLEATARSLAAGGFRTILFLGDSGPNQRPQAAVAERLDAEFRSRGIRVYQMDAYYSGSGQREWLLSQGFSEAQIGLHAGMVDTPQLMAVAPGGVRTDRLAESAAGAASGADGEAGNGVVGDPSGATAAIGARLLELKIAAAVREIREKLAAGD